MPEIRNLDSIIIPEPRENEALASTIAAATKYPSAVAASGLSAQINAGSLCVFNKDLTKQNIADASNSLLFSQLAATYQHNRFTTPSEWTKAYFTVLGQIGWNQSRFSTSGESLAPPVDWEKLVVNSLGGAAAALAEAGMKVAQRLPQDSKAMVIWNENAVDANYGDFQVVSAARVDGSVQMTISWNNFEFRRLIDGFLSWTRSYYIKFGVSVLVLNEDVYAQVREQIIKKLGDRPERYVANVPM